MNDLIPILGEYVRELRKRSMKLDALESMTASAIFAAVATELEERVGDALLSWMPGKEKQRPTGRNGTARHRILTLLVGEEATIYCSRSNVSMIRRKCERYGCTFDAKKLGHNIYLIRRLT